MPLLDSQALQTFVCVAETGSFSAAAEIMHLTQPAVSKRIALLERQLGSRIFDRIRKKVFLTDAGRALLPRARAILQELADTQRMVSDLGGQVAGRLRIAFSHHVGLHRLPPYLKRFTTTYPDVTLDIDFLDSEKAYNDILQGKTELAVITLSPGTEDGVLTTHLWQDPLVFVCSKEHPLHLRDNVSLKELSKLDAILPGTNTYTGKIVREAFAKQNLELTNSMTTNYLETIKMMISIGLGWSVLPKTMQGKLEAIHLNDIYIERSLGIIQYREKKLSNAAEAFKHLLLDSQFADSNPKCIISTRRRG